MQNVAEKIANGIDELETTELLCRPQTGVVNWRPKAGVSEQQIRDLRGISSTVLLNGQTWMSNVAASPHADAKE